MKKHYLLSINIFLCTIFVVASSSIVSHSDDHDKLIVKACSDTPKPELCFNYIKSDPSNKNVKNVSDVGIIMAKVLKRNAKVARDKIQRIASAKNTQDLKVQLKACLASYNNILHIDVKVAIESFKDRNPRLAEIGADTAADGVSDCEESFNGKSPITTYNNRIHDIALLLAAIAKELQVEN
ncbi:hypothetical protein PIB30_027208 [Stylosanthes scabra]|uniref:Pectinesterase inhibitor domain-containing protein n=1 Tax=Stylosanthes scabra TaxID=79078 RepID=A0ABU6TA96_9FABA|nr:hypothetical protein [Stylosanthes scabra]